MEFFLCGLDEAGRGPLAGPVVAGAVVLPPDFPVEILDDSKRLSAKKRSLAEEAIKQKACWGIGLVGHETIDRVNILRASLMAMRMAYAAMRAKLDSWAIRAGLAARGLEAIADGTFAPDIGCPCRAEAKADGKYPCVMAASVMAKQARDRIMVEMDALYPRYGYARHKGYPTARHVEICRKIGPSPIQRLTFKY